jgi:hypothetical protein
MTVKIKLGGKKTGAQLRLNMQRKSKLVREAVAATAKIAAETIETEGRADIAGAGNFGARWTDGFQAKVTQGGGNTVVNVTMAVPYWRVFEFGATIEGKPLLWIPLSFAGDAIGVRARDYPGQLFRVDRHSGAPLLMAPGNPAQPKYFGKESVTIPQKFHLRDIIKGVGRSLRDIYRGVRAEQRG